MIHIVENIGRQVIRSIENSGRIVILISQVLYHLRRPPRMRHVLQQMVHLGVDSLPIVLLAMLFTGMVITLQTANSFIKYGAQSSVGGVVAISMARELAPVITSVVVAGRVGAAIAAEIGTMKVTEQIDALRVMAVNPIQYLVIPRLIACVIMVPMLVVFADVIGTIGGYLVATLYSGIGSVTYLNSIQGFVEVFDVVGGLIKAMFFGGIIAIIGCYKGLTTEEGAEGVGLSTTAAVVSSMTIIFISNYFLSLLLYR